MNEYSKALFAEPSFIEGMARIFDFANTLTEYNRSLSAQQADYLAILSDWRAVGADIQRAVELFGASLPKDR